MGRNKAKKGSYIIAPSNVHIVKRVEKHSKALKNID
jgi:hypothetical protein